jgi:hypothetical protein
MLVQQTRRDTTRTTVRNTTRASLRTLTETSLTLCLKGSVWSLWQGKRCTGCSQSTRSNWRLRSTRGKPASATPGAVPTTSRAETGITTADSNLYLTSIAEQSELCPDDISFNKLVSVLKDTASSNSFLPTYRTGRMTDTVYSVKGGMEDWVYGVGWENQVNTT